MVELTCTQMLKDVQGTEYILMVVVCLLKMVWLKDYQI
jgi:hypothetical protein